MLTEVPGWLYLQVRSPNGATHPLDPLSVEELQRAVELTRTAEEMGPRTYFVSMALKEPTKEELTRSRDGSELPRLAEGILFDRDSSTTYEVVVSLSDDELVEVSTVPDAQAPLLVEEYFEVERLMKADPRFQEALRRRGVDDLEQVAVDPVPPAHFGIPEEEGKRLARAIAFQRPKPGGNQYARPIEGVLGLVDLDRSEVLEVEDNGVVPLPSEDDGDFRAERIELRDDVKPLEITQPEGPSFEVEGNCVRWQRWRFRVGFTAREGLVLHTVGFEHGDRVRPILHRASYSEMAVPYGHPDRYFLTPFDIGENLIGTLVDQLELGCDCLGLIHYFDAAIVDHEGQAVQLRNAICMHEEDYGILWKHTDFRTEHTEVRRSRRLVVSSISTIGNYTYGFFWYLYQDGTIESEVKLTGLMSTSAVAPEEPAEYGTMVAPGVNAPIHQHFFNVRLDFDLDGRDNTVLEVHTESAAADERNPHGTAFRSVQRPLRRESEAQRLIDLPSARSWLITNPHVRNAVGDPVAYRLVPGENVLPFAQPDSSYTRRAAFTTKHVWVTPYQPRERYAAGEYPNANPGPDGLGKWTQEDRPLEDTDVVLWYSMGSHHLTRPEDWPIMPVTYIGFALKPFGFFDRNPALDVPPPANGHCSTT